MCMELLVLSLTVKRQNQKLKTRNGDHLPPMLCLNITQRQIVDRQIFFAKWGFH